MGALTYTYLLVRQDLPAPVQLVQACHAAFEMAWDLERPAAPAVDNLIALAVKDVHGLLDARERLERAGIRHHLFHEPDLPGYTALCTEPLGPERKGLFKRWQLVA